MTTQSIDQSVKSTSKCVVQSPLFGPVANIPKDLPTINQFLISTHESLVALAPPQPVNPSANQSINESQKSRVCLVLGNESCDFDSTISSIALSYYFSLTKPINQSNSDASNPANQPNNQSVNQSINQAVLYAPLINVPRRYFRLREELCFALKQQGIDWQTLTFIDDIDLKSLPINQSIMVVLTDHNRLSPSQSWLAGRVIGTVDHHFDEHLYSEESINRFVAKTGSCSSHVVNLVNKSNPQFWTTSYSLFPLINLLIDCLLLDTHNFDQSLGKTTEHDLAALAILNKSHNYLQFTYLKKLRSNVSGWTSEELLLKDSKLYEVGPYTVMLSTVPMKIDEWQINQPNLVDQLATLTNHLDAVMVLTSFTDKSTNPPSYRREILLVVSTVKPTQQDKQVVKDAANNQSINQSNTRASNQHRLSPDQLFEQLTRGLEQDTQLNLHQIDQSVRPNHASIGQSINASINQSINAPVTPVLSRRYNQLNVGASRKQIAPRVEEILSKLSKL